MPAVALRVVSDMVINIVGIKRRDNKDNKEGIKSALGGEISGIAGILLFI